MDLFKKGVDRMRQGAAFAALATAGLWLLGCGCGSSGAVSGKVLLDGAAAAGQEVVLEGGIQFLTATTGPDGAYRFQDVPEGDYLLAVDLASTRERHLEVAVAVKEPVAVPDLTFQGVASLSGTVTNTAKAPVAGAQVQVLGTQVSGVTDAAGGFAFSEVPSGTRTVAVTSPDGSAQLEVTLARGETKAVAIGLTAAPPATVTGQAAFFSRTDLSVIEVSIPAAGATTHADAEGQYSLSVPPGEWDLYAKAPYYPSQKIGHVQVASGEAVSLPAATLSLYTDLPAFGGQSARWDLPDGQFGVNPRASVLLTLSPPNAVPAYYAFDLVRRSLRLISVGAKPTLSPDGRWAAIEGRTGVAVLDLDTSGNFTVPHGGTVHELWFSSDSSTLFFNLTGTPTLFFVVKLADQTVTTLQDYDERDLNQDRWLVRTTDVAPITWKLVTPQGITTAFSNVPFVYTLYQGTLVSSASSAFGLEACPVAPCRVDVLGPEASTAVASTWTPANTTFPIHVASGAWLLAGDGAQLAVIDTASGATTLLPATARDGSFSLDGSRIAYFAQSGTQLFEHALPLPDPTTLTPSVSAAGALRGSWTSGARYVGFDDTPAAGAASRFTLESGAVARDLDYAPGSGDSTIGQFPRWLGTDGTARFVLGAGPVHAAPEGQTVLPSTAGLEFRGEAATWSPGEKLAVSWTSGRTWYFDGDAAPRSDPTFLPNSGVRPFIDDLMLVVDVGGRTLLRDFDSGQRIALEEPGRAGLTIDVSLTAPPAIVLVHSTDPDANEWGGAYALLPRFFLY